MRPVLPNPSHSLQPVPAPLPVPGAPTPRSQPSWWWRRYGPSATCRWPAGSSRSRLSACPSCGRPSPAAPPSPPAWGRLSSLQGQQGHCQAQAPLDPAGCSGKGQAPPGTGAEPLCGPTDEDIQPVPSPLPLGQRQGALGLGEIPAPELGAHLRLLRAGSPAPESWGGRAEEGCLGGRAEESRHITVLVGTAASIPARGAGVHGGTLLVPWMEHPAPAHLPARAGHCLECCCRHRWAAQTLVSYTALALLGPSSAAAEGSPGEARGPVDGGSLSPSPWALHGGCQGASAEVTSCCSRSTLE